MAKKEKRISINALEKIAKEQFAESVTKQWFDVEVIIKHSLSLVEMLELVNEVLDASFAPDGTFMPEIMDFSLKSGILTKYANFTLPENLEKQYELVYRTGVADMVIEHINTNQLDEIINAVNRKVDNMCKSDILALRFRLEKLLESFDTMQKQTADMFDGLNSDDAQILMKALSEVGTLDENKLVDAYMNKAKAAAVADEASADAKETLEQ